MSFHKQARFRLKQSLAWLLVPIAGGPLKGHWFGLFTGTRFLRGNYGGEEFELFQRLVQPGQVVYDIGAHVGYFTLLAARLVGPAGRVIAFEPLPLNLAYLRNHVRSNRLAQVEVMPAAVGGEAGKLSLGSKGGTGRGRLSGDGSGGNDNLVNVVSLDSLIEGRSLPAPDLIKMDVEGVEADALRGAEQLLAAHRPVILLSLHGSKAKADCEALLRRIGYQLTYLGKSNVLAV